MQNFKKLTEILKSLNLPKGEYAIFGSGPLAVRKIRDSSDLDVILTEALFEKLKKKKEFIYSTEKDGYKVERLLLDNIEFFKSWAPGNWDTNELVKNAEEIDGLCFVKLSEVIKWKKLLGREKDKKDLKLIDEYLKNAS